MGAETFTTYAEGADVDTAFRAAIEQAQYDYGHAGYTGTIAEKASYIVIDDAPRSEGDAEALAEKLINDDDERIADKWGPAGAIPVRGGSSESGGRSAPVRATAERLDKPAEIEARRDNGVEDSTTVTSAPEVTGWLFFGWASC
ncbi:hypothetical protein [Amycolatopsis magusensis]|uniref:hypothetical protein n=1 Tax=Amycolatopsis magusensis TaxID=882444 RepID=UPI0037927C8E